MQVSSKISTAQADLIRKNLGTSCKVPGHGDRPAIIKEVFLLEPPEDEKTHRAVLEFADEENGVWWYDKKPIGITQAKGKEVTAIIVDRWESLLRSMGKSDVFLNLDDPEVLTEFRCQVQAAGNAALTECGWNVERIEVKFAVFDVEGQQVVTPLIQSVVQVPESPSDVYLAINLCNHRVPPEAVMI